MITFIFAVLMAASQLADGRAHLNPCALVSTADASRAVGSSIARLKTSPEGRGTACSYETGRQGHSLLFTVYEGSSREEAAVTFEEELQANARFYVEPAVEIAHLGDGAKAFGHILWVRRGSFVFVINVVDAGVQGKTLKRALSLAHKAIARIDAWEH